ncbi:MAG: hypothetical protein A2Y56_03135 [Candidatus Aminicenantes bacterium RBG_13_63_10]|nr:MAG: hypothetical protein A2Y56_03135 [Candidatus Aminicenantes bacterium RBG_13_63_10]
MYILYSFLLALALAALLPVYFIRLRLREGKPLALAQRLGLGLPARAPGRVSLWMHAVSVGEVLSLQKLAREVKDRHPDWALHVSVLTQAGMEVARKKLASADRLFFAPLDFGWTARRFLRRFEPGLLILAESELWPNLLRQARKSGRGVLLVNGRVSERSFHRYRRLRFFTGRLFGDIALFLVQTEQDRERLIGSGARPERVRISGNLKCEITPGDIDPETLKRRREEISLPRSKKLVVAGSTREGEETLLLEAFRESRRARTDVGLVLAPRHMDRVAEVEKACGERGLRARRRTEIRKGEEWDVLLLDTIGELSEFYALGDAAFVGGSLVPWGGHNLLEPAAYGKPIFFGPHMKNFAFLADVFTAAGAARVVRSPGDLRDMFLFPDPAGLRVQGEKSLQTLKSLQGATARTIKVIENMIAGLNPAEGI